jgi:hypothetical protein
MSDDIQELLCWYEVRDLLVGGNKVQWDLSKAIARLPACKHRDAVWLSKVFSKRNSSDLEGVIACLRVHETDPRSQSFLATFEGDMLLMQTAAENGDAFAQAAVAWEMGGHPFFVLAEQSAAQGERDGLVALGCAYLRGWGCKVDKEKAKEKLLRAVALKGVFAFVNLGECFVKTDPQRYFWMAKGGSFGLGHRFLMDASKYLATAQTQPNVVFEIGRCLQGHIDLKKKAIFGNSDHVEGYFAAAVKANCFYMFQIQAYRRAVDVWTIVGLRNNVVKDIRLLIAKMIWGSRVEARSGNVQSEVLF